MIVQSASAGERSFVITMQQHTEFAGRLARAFGNDRFEPVAPRDEMLYVIDNHDAGWAALDAAAPIDPKTGLPYNLTETPFEKIIETSVGSPDFNSRRHPYCGLISSMHSWGLYNGRYGLSDHVLLDGMAAENRALADDMLDGEAARQADITESLAADPAVADWVEKPHLFQNYKQLQFFDTMALYFNRAHEGGRAEASFPHVPMTGDEDATVEIAPLGEGRYKLSPYPLSEDACVLWFEGRYVLPSADGAAAALATAPVERQFIILTAG